MMSNEIDQLVAGPLYRFADWPNPAVPNWRAGVYSIWEGDTFVYVGMAGRGMEASSHETIAAASPRAKGLRDRLASHASGRRSGDQFCIYVFDRLVLPALGTDQIAAAARGDLSLDGETRRYIHERLSYRFAVAEDGRRALAIERTLQRDGLHGQKPLLNPR